jgi:hypothetical protein
MRIGMPLSYARGFWEAVDDLADFEKAGPLPEKAHEIWGAPLAGGRARRAPNLGELDVVVGVLNLTPLAESRTRRIKDIETVRDLVG